MAPHMHTYPGRGRGFASVLVITLLYTAYRSVNTGKAGPDLTVVPLNNANLVQEYVESSDTALFQLGRDDELLEHSYDKRGGVDSSAVNLPLINFNRHMEGEKRQTWARFIWAKSMTWPNSYDPAKPPMVITVPGCDKWTGKRDKLEDYTKKPLQTSELVDKGEHARECQSFYLRKVDDDHPYNTRAEDGTRSYPIAVTTASNMDSKIGWNATCDKATGKSSITWVPEIKVFNNDSQIITECDWWWRESERILNGPQFYGLFCLLRLRVNPEICVKADAKNPKDKELIFEACDTKKRDEMWHIQSTAHEWPCYWKDCAPTTDTAACKDEDGGRMYAKLKDQTRKTFDCGKHCDPEDTPKDT